MVSKWSIIVFSVGGKLCVFIRALEKLCEFFEIRFLGFCNWWEWPYYYIYIQLKPFVGRTDNRFGDYKRLCIVSEEISK